MSVEELKERAKGAIEAARKELVELSRKIHSHPEVGYQEFQAANWLTDLLEKHGYEVKRGIGGLDTAFLAVCSGEHPSPTVALIAEYDALPDVGHGCGHNLIAAGAVGAAIGVKAVAESLVGNVHVYGTPAEEVMSRPAGKIILLEADAFRGIDLCVMFHPYVETMLPSTDLGVTVVNIFFQGRPAHAAADPWHGANALDGVLMTYNGINALRQHLKPDVRIHGIVTDGGKVPNVVPEHASARFAIRSVDRDYLEEVVSKVRACAEGAALATGTKVNFEVVSRINSTCPNRVLESVIRSNLNALGVEAIEGVHIPGSTDFGNLSQSAPAYWFMLRTHPSDTPWHSKEAAKLAVSEQAHAGMMTGAKVLAWSVIDLLSEPRLIEQAKVEFDQRRK